jgi:ABC-type multidrug transport system fused ATPase/permease subunit
VDSFCDSSGAAQCPPLPSFFQGFHAIQFIILLLGMSLLGFLNTFFFRVIFSRLSAKAVSQIYDETTLRTSRQPMSFFDSTPAGRIITRFSSDYGNIFRLFGGPLAELFAIIFDLISMLILITVASPVYLPLVLIIALLDYGIYRLNIDKLRLVRRNLSASRSPSIAHFAETAQGASTIRSFLKQNSFNQRFKSLDQNYLDNKLYAVKALLGFSFQINCMTALFLLSTGLLAWWLLQHQFLTIGSIGVAFSFIALSGNTVQMFFEWVSQFEEALVGVERMDQYLRSPTEIGSLLPATAKFPTAHSRKKTASETLPGAELKKLGAASVDFENVTFRYRESLPLVLKNLSFHISAGERFGVVGRTGSGKSSLIQALFQLYPLSSGCIRINGFSAKDVDLMNYRQSMAFIAQDPTLFKGSLKENLDITYQCSPADLYQALNKVGLSEWANPEGLLKTVEEKGRNLSLGERQLICMARCLLQNAPVIIMDEATSSVDPQTEEILVRATEDFFKGKTQIIIAHRLSTLLNCDRVLWLQNGEVKALGPPHEVLPPFQRANLSL